MRSLLRCFTGSLARSSALPLLLALSMSGACTDVPVDTVRGVPPGGVIHATVQYIGPRPECRWTTTGNGQQMPTAFVGRFVFTLIDTANPLPPAGTAQLPADILTLDAQYVFTDLARQCMPASPTPSDLATNIQVSAAFDVHNVKLAKGAGATITYNLQGFWDHQGDFNPLFNVLQSNNHGDVAGAAVVDPTAAVPAFAPIVVGSAEDNPNGVAVSGVNVAIAAAQATVNTDPNAFYVVQDKGALASDAAWPLDPAPQYSAPHITFRLFGRAAADADRAAIDTVRTATNTTSLIDFSNVDAYAWYKKGFPINGQPAYHPIWGNKIFPVPALWTTPVLFLQRAKNSFETQSGVPAVAIIPLADPDHTTQVYYPSIDFAVPQVAAVQLNPAIAACTVLYVNDGSVALAMNVPPTPASGPATCEEFPTGFYGANVIGGVAGGTFSDAGAAVTETGRDLNGGQLASQVWRLPNVYGDAAQVGADHVVPSQGLTGAVLVHDPNPSSLTGVREARRNGNTGFCSSGPDNLGFNVPYDMKTWPNDPTHSMGPTAATQQNCCDAVRHLCDVPLCDYVDAHATWSSSTFRVRAQPTSVTTNADGQNVPNCVAFPMPQQCCERYGM